MSYQVWTAEQVEAVGRPCYGGTRDFAIIENPLYSPEEEGQEPIVRLTLTEVFEEIPMSGMSTLAGNDRAIRSPVGNEWEPGFEFTLQNVFEEKIGRVTIKWNDLLDAYEKLAELRASRAHEE